MNILLVDDEPLMLEQLEMVVSSKFPNWKFHKAIDASQALSISRNQTIHLAFLDIKLPGKTGLELGEELKTIHTSIDIIIVTAFQNFDYAKQSIRLGVIDYLTKPIIETELDEILWKYKSSSRYSPLLNDVLLYVHEYYSNRITLTSIAEHVHCNATYISRRFHQEVGVTFNEYLTKYRIEKSKRYLVMNVDWPISHIAEQVGFASQHYFSTMFRKIVQLSPKQYREQELEI